MCGFAQSPAIMPWLLVVNWVQSAKQSVFFALYTGITHLTFPIHFGDHHCLADHRLQRVLLLKFLLYVLLLLQMKTQGGKFGT
jgi:hypothetical protein